MKTPAMERVRPEASCTTYSSKRSMRKAAMPPREASLVGVRVRVGVRVGVRVRVRVRRIQLTWLGLGLGIGESS